MERDARDGQEPTECVFHPSPPVQILPSGLRRERMEAWNESPMQAERQLRTELRAKSHHQRLVRPAVCSEHEFCLANVPESPTEIEPNLADLQQLPGGSARRQATTSSPGASLNATQPAPATHAPQAGADSNVSGAGSQPGGDDSGVLGRMLSVSFNMKALMGGVAQTTNEAGDVQVDMQTSSMDDLLLRQPKGRRKASGAGLSAF